MLPLEARLELAPNPPISVAEMIGNGRIRGLELDAIGLFALSCCVASFTSWVRHTAQEEVDHNDVDTTGDA